MPTYSVSFDVSRADTLDLPVSLLDKGKYQVKADKDGSVEISGNRDGLLYLAEVLVRCAIGSYKPGFHLHLPLDSDVRGPNVDASPELTIHAASPRGRHLAVDK
jgi:hypothetical protein